MTLIVGTAEGVWADRRVTGGDGALFRPSRKVVRGDEIVAAFCGSDADCCRAMAAVRAGEADPTALAAISDGVVVTDAGRYELASGIATRIPARIPLAMGGSGYAEAQAYLYGALHRHAHTRGVPVCVPRQDGLRRWGGLRAAALKIAPAQPYTWACA